MIDPDPNLLERLVRIGLGRGLPVQAAEDVVYNAWEKCSSRFDPSRGAFSALMERTVRNDCAQWWRERQRERAVYDELPPPDPARARDHRELIGRLDPESLRIFQAWATQRHLGKGRVSNAAMAASLDLTVREYENAKKRLKFRLRRLAAESTEGIHVR